MFRGIFNFFTGSEDGISSTRKCIGIFILLLAGSIYLLFQSKYIEVWEVESNSMQPLLEIGDRIVKVTTTNFEKGDVIVFYSYDDPDMPMVKRLVGVEGDKVEVADGTLYVNKKQMYPWTRYRDYPMPRDKKWTIKPGELFVAGDNQLVSDDSRYIGPIDIDQVDGKVFFRILPNERRGRIMGEFPPPDPLDYLSSL